MGLRINTNIEAIKAQRNFSINQKSLSRTLERLSSGLRINRAADDAAGLAISEKLRTQIRGFSQAVSNAQDGINLVATAEGGLEVTTQILQRMRELSIQAANDTLTNNDREKVQEEIKQLREELTRLAETTEFNTRKLLDGSIAGTTFGEDASLEIEQNVRVGDTSATIPSLKDFISTASISATGATVDVAYQLKFVSYQGANASDPVSVAIEVRSSVEGLLTTIQLNSGAAGTNATQVALTIGQTTGSAVVIGTLDINSNSISLGDIGKTAMVQVTARRAAVTSDDALTFQVGPNEGQFVKIGVSDMRAAALRLETINLLGTNDEDSRVKAQNAIGALDQALDFVNAVRARLGAFQNRVEQTISRLSISKENTAAAESRIRDADIAAETANLTRSQILVQAGTAVLAQANLAPQSALSLLG